MKTVTGEIRGARLTWDDEGAGDQTVVLVHGLMLASESWESQRAALRSSYRVISLDLRGQGRSATTTEGLDLDSLAEDVNALIERVGGPVHLVGFSMGAFICMRVAARHPDAVRSLTLIGPSAEAESRAKMPGYTLLLALVGLFGPRFVVPFMMRILFGSTFGRAPEHADARRRWRATLEALPKSITLAARASAHRSAIVGELPKIQAPTLIFSGEEDQPVPPRLARAVAQAIRGARLISVPQSGHAVMLERPELFNAELQSFLAATAATTR